MGFLSYCWLLGYFLGGVAASAIHVSAWIAFVYFYLVYVPDDFASTYFALVVANLIVAGPRWKARAVD